MSYEKKIVLRNSGFISNELQSKLKKVKILIAGCGSIGGGSVELLVRTGVRNLKLAEPDIYDYTNINRQSLYFNDVNRNKALVLEEKIHKINPYCKTKVYQDGINTQNINTTLEDIDIVIDGIDVTTKEGWEAKYLLHTEAKKRRIIVISGYDMDTTQYVLIHNYKKDNESLFKGRISKKHIKQFDPLINCVFLITPKNMPLGIFEELDRVEKNNKSFISQLGIAANLYAIIATSAILKILDKRDIKEEIYIDMWKELNTYTQEDKLKHLEFQNRWNNNLKKLSKELL
jgi:tRNA A37 threonylcarbamoyladenosine dehydratase